MATKAKDRVHCAYCGEIAPEGKERHCSDACRMADARDRDPGRVARDNAGRKARRDKMSKKLKKLESARQAARYQARMARQSTQ